MNLRSILLLLRHASLKTFQKGELLIEKDSTHMNIFYIRSGLVRSFFINEETDEITFQLFPEYALVVNVQAILFDTPSKFSYEALETTRVYQINFQAFRELATQNAKVLNTNQKLLFQHMLQQVYQRVESFVLLSPEERYLKYMQDYPQVINRAPDKYIAHVLGITPVSLSRIRSRIASKKN